MSDVTNPGVVNVADEVLENPDPNNSLRLHMPEQDDHLVDADAQGYPRAENDVDATVFPTPAEVKITQVPTGQKVLAHYTPDAEEVIVDDQVIGQGSWVYVDPTNPALGKRFVPPGDFLVVGPADTIQTNSSETTTILCTVVNVYDADNLWNPPGAQTTRLLISIAPPSLTGLPISILGRNITFTPDTLTAQDQEAVRSITGYGVNYVTVNIENLSDQTVPTLTAPVTGDTFTIETQRQGSQGISNTNNGTIDVTIAPAPPAFLPNPGQALNNKGNVNVTVGPQPGQIIITGGIQVPTAINVNVADQATVVGMPTNVFI